jgi:hypothetical protein
MNSSEILDQVLKANDDLQKINDKLGAEKEALQIQIRELELTLTKDKKSPHFCSTRRYITQSDSEPYSEEEEEEEAVEEGEEGEEDDISVNDPEALNWDLFCYLAKRPTHEATDLFHAHNKEQHLERRTKTEDERLEALYVRVYLVLEDLKKNLDQKRKERKEEEGPGEPQMKVEWKVCAAQRCECKAMSLTMCDPAQFTVCSPSYSAKLEERFQKLILDSNEKPEIEHSEGVFRWLAFIPQRYQLNPLTGTVRKLQREETKIIRFDDHLFNLPPTLTRYDLLTLKKRTISMIPLNQHDLEYDTLANLYSTPCSCSISGDHAKVISKWKIKHIWKIINPHRFCQYILRSCPSLPFLEKTLYETFAFHGARTNTDEVILQGVDPRCSQSGYLGYAAYFSRCPALSVVNYCEPKNNCKWLLGCRVLVGDAPFMEPAKNDSKGLRKPPIPNWEGVLKDFRSDKKVESFTIPSSIGTIEPQYGATYFATYDPFASYVCCAYELELVGA